MIRSFENSLSTVFANRPFFFFFFFLREVDISFFPLGEKKGYVALPSGMVGLG